MAASSGRRSIYFGVAAGLCSLTVLAAEPPSNADDDSGVEEVVVTAQKREERSIDVPVVINSVNAEELATQNLSGIRDYYSRVPGLAYDGNKTYNLSLRGVTTGNATNPTLSILLDDVQFGASTVAGLGNSLFPDFDPSILERIEVLHGPQGTLYGAASLGGLIKFVTRQPDPGRFSARLEAGAQSVKGGDTGWGARGTVNIPLIAEKMALRVSGFNREDPAYIDNIHAGLEGKDVNNAHIRGGHASLLFKPIDNLAITLSALQQKRDADFSPSTRVGADATRVPNYEPLFGKDKVDLAATSDIGDQKLYSGRIVFDAGGVEFTSITAYGKSAGTNFQDVSSVFAFLGAPPFYNLPGLSVSIDDVAHTNKFSQELRLSGTSGQIDWRTGLFYTREKSSVDQALQVFDPSGAFLATAFDGLGPNSYRERAIFGDVVFHMTEQWDLQAGARYAKNKQASGGSVIIDGPAQPAFGPSGDSPEPGVPRQLDDLGDLADLSHHPGSHGVSASRHRLSAGRPECGTAERSAGIRSGQGDQLRSRVQGDPRRSYFQLGGGSVPDRLARHPAAGYRRRHAVHVHDQRWQGAQPWCRGRNRLEAGRGSEHLCQRQRSGCDSNRDHSASLPALTRW